MERAAVEGKWDRESLLPHYTGSSAAYNVAIPIGWWGGAPAFVSPDEIARDLVADRAIESAAQSDLARDVFGNPFRHESIDQAWLTWSDGAIPKLAQTIYEEKAFQQLPALADALEAAGCRNDQILSHCRHPGPHVRGCWVLDLIMGRR
jgi:hypothetical protein